MTKHREELLSRFPKASGLLDSLSRLNTKAFAIAAAEELLVILLFSLFAFLFPDMGQFLWSAILLAFVLHLFVHVGQGILIRGYVPGIATSIALLPFAVWSCMELSSTMSLTTLLMCAVSGVLFMVVNLRFAHWLGIKLACVRR